MKCVFFLAAVLVTVVAESFYYVTDNDYIDVDAIIADTPLFKNYIDCFLDRTPCTTHQNSYKRIIQDSVIRACDRCNLPQKQRYAKFLWALRSLVPHEYINFRLKYDPAGIYFDRLEAELAKYLEYPTSLISLPYFYYLNKK